jgi:hypothetical protein
MYKFDRMQWPRKYPVPNWIKLMIVVMFFVGVIITNHSQRLLTRDIRISDIKISEYSRVHVDVEYTISNRSSVDRDVWLILQVYDNKSALLGNALFLVNCKAKSTQERLKMIDKLVRPLENNEKPAKATLEVYNKKVI